MDHLHLSMVLVDIDNPIQRGSAECGSGAKLSDATAHKETIEERCCGT
jgi:hypothetical protein